MDPDPELDPTPFSSEFQDAKKISHSFFYKFSAGTSSSVLKVKLFAKNFV
jgi:hypothetical protein